MYQDKKILALIPARGGSKGLPGKNLMKIKGQSMIEITFKAASGSKYIDKIVLSSEDPKIITEAKKIGIEVPFIRPAYLSNDYSSGNDVVEHALNQCPGFDYIVLLQPTSPLRKAEDIDEAIKKCVCNKKNTCVSVTAVKKSPFWMYKLESDCTLIPIFNSHLRLKNRQEHPVMYIPNGAVYISKCSTFLKNKSFIEKDTIAHIMPGERSIDIDDRLDFIFAKFLFENEDYNNHE